MQHKHKILSHPEFQNKIELVVSQIVWEQRRQYGIELYTRQIGKINSPKQCHTIIPMKSEIKMIAYFDKFGDNELIEYLEGWERILKANKSLILLPNKRIKNLN